MDTGKWAGKKDWKIVRNRACIRALLIFLGVVLMQVLAYLACTFFLVAGFVLTGQGMQAALGRLSGISSESGTFLILLSLVSALFSAVWCGILYVKSSWREWPFDYKRAFRKENLFAIFGIGAGGCLFLTALLTALSLFVPEAFSSYQSVMDSLTGGSVAISMAYVLLVGPVSEELIFRGAIFDRFYLAFPFLAANFFQAALFGIYHMNLIQGLYAFCLGFALGMVRFVSGSILASMLTHILFNATSYVIDAILPENSTMQVLFLFLCLSAGGIFCFFSFRFLWKKLQNHS